MSLFEYIAAAYSLLISFAVARVVFGLPSAILKDRRYWVHLAFLAGFSFYLALMFWAFWSYRDIDWTFLRFLLCLSSPVLALFMASTLIPASSNEVQSWRDFYYSVRSKYFSAWIAAVVLVAVNATLLLDMPFTHPARIGQLSLAAIGVVGVSSSNPRVHEGLAISLIAVLALEASVIFLEPGSLAN